MTDHGADGAGPDDTDGVGDLGEEAARLLGVLAGLTRGIDEHVATGAPECEWCPVCRAVHVVRTASPEVREHLTTAASSLLAAAASLLAGAGVGGDPASGAAGGTDEDPADDGLEHIDLDPPPGGGEEEA